MKAGRGPVKAGGAPVEEGEGSSVVSRRGFPRRPNERGSGGLSRAACLFLAWLCLFPGRLHGQLLFPDLLPPDAAVILTIPRADGAWRAFESMRIIQSADAVLGTETAAGQEGLGPSLGLELKGEALFGGILSATELAITPASTGAPPAFTGAPPAFTGAPLAPSPSRSPVFLWLGAVKDQQRLREALDVFEKKALSLAATPTNPVTRSVESIGDTSLILLTDPSGTVGRFINGPRAIWAFSNHAETLRQTARRLEARPPLLAPASETEQRSRKRAESESANAPFAQSLRAWREVERLTRGKDPFHVRFFIAAPRANAAGAAPVERRMLEGSNAFSAGGAGFGGIDPLLRRIRPQGATAGGIRFTPDTIEVESLSLFSESDSSLSARLYASAPGAKDLPGTPFFAPTALIFGGNSLLDAPRIKRFLLAAVEGWRASLPPRTESGLNPASNRAHAALDTLRDWLTDPELFAELGPAWFFALNDFQFGQPGEFPRVDFLLGIGTRDAATTRRRMLRFEEVLCAAATEWIRNRRGVAGASPGLPGRESTPTKPDSPGEGESARPKSLADSATREDPGQSGPASGRPPGSPRRDTAAPLTGATPALTGAAPASTVTISFKGTPVFSGDAASPGATPALTGATPASTPGAPETGSIRFLDAPGLPPHLRPAWTISQGHLLIGLSPSSLTEALQRHATGGDPASDLAATRRELGVETVHAYHVIRFRRVARVLVAILGPIVRKADPQAAPQLGRLARVLEPIETISFFRSATGAGIRTVGQIRMQPPEGGDSP